MYTVQAIVLCAIRTTTVRPRLILQAARTRTTGARTSRSRHTEGLTPTDDPLSRTMPLRS